MKSRILATLTLLFALGVPARAYYPSRSAVPTGVVQLRWASFPVVWHVTAAAGPAITGTRTVAEVTQASFTTWQSASSAQITLTRGTDSSTTAAITGSDETNVIRTNQTQAEYINSTDDTLNATLGVTLSTSDDEGKLLDADIVINPAPADGDWSTNLTTPGDRYDLESVLTHEIGHFLGLDHSSIMSATMAPSGDIGVNRTRVLSSDDIAGIGSIYPSSTYLTRGAISGVVRLTTNNGPVYGALVVVVNSNGQPVASSITDTSGRYFISGLDPGNYTVLAEPMDRPFVPDNIPTLPEIAPGRTPATNFTTRFR